MKHEQINTDPGQHDSRGSQLSRRTTSFPPGFTCGGIVFLFVLMTIVVACGSDTNQSVVGTPVSTLTVVFGPFKTSPTPRLSPYYCGGWVTDTTPVYTPKSVVNVYGKFTQTQNDNPVGVNGATAVARVLWPDGSTQTEQAITSSDGLAVFSIALQASAINHVVLVQIVLSSKP
jgi:hypothetical protein